MDLDQRIDHLRREPAASGIFVDFDGTLAPIVDNPREAAPVAGAAEVLDGLARRYALVALVSGRAAGDLWERLEVQGPRYLGLYGAEEMTPGGLQQSPMAPRWHRTARALADDAQRAVHSLQLDGCEVEYKDLAVSVHYRHLGTAEPPPELLEWAREAAGRTGFQLGPGRRVLEFKPPSVSKASTLQRLMVQSGLEHAFVGGDDTADVAMMQRAAHFVSGVLLRVGVLSGETPEGLVAASEVQVASPQEMVALLARLV